jgi:hypothetical protein
VDWEPVQVQEVDNQCTVQACTAGRPGAGVYSDWDIHKDQVPVLQVVLHKEAGQEVVLHKEAGHRDQMVAAHTEIGRRGH